MSVLENPKYKAAALALTDEVQGYYREHGFLTEGGCWDSLVQRLEVRESDLEELLEEIERKAVCEDDRANLEFPVKHPEYAPAKNLYLSHCDELINEKCRQILWPRFVPAPLPAWPVAA